MSYAIGLDYGSNSVRAVIIDTAGGEELATSIYDYSQGEKGILLDPSDHNLARQDPADYLTGLETTVTEALKLARNNHPSFSPDKIIGIGVDTTGSTPIPVDKNGQPLCFQDTFKKNLNAYAWLWKDHTGTAEAEEITALARKTHPEYLSRCGGTYSSEWFFSKILHCLRTDPKICDAACRWVECCDYIPAVLTDNMNDPKISRCAAGHKAMFNPQWGGLPAKEFLNQLDPRLGELRDRLYSKSYSIDTSAGQLCPAWAKKLGLPTGIAVAVGAFDAHLGAVGAGIGPGKLVKIIGTSTCDIMVAPSSTQLQDIPGLCGIVDGSVIPEFWGLEAGQSAVGDIFSWFVDVIRPGGMDHETLTQKAAGLKPGQSGLLALDWNNGNRTILVDQKLTGLLMGQTLHSRPEEIYLTLIEATAFGALTIINRLEEYGVNVSEIINCGGIAKKNPLLMQVYADVTGREMKISRSSQTCALGAAIAGAVVAGKTKSGYDTVQDAQTAMCRDEPTTYKPIAEHHRVYQQLYGLYRQLHDAFGLTDSNMPLGRVMKELLEIKSKVKA